MIVDGWLDWTVHQPGPTDKTYSQPNSANQSAMQAASESYAMRLRSYREVTPRRHRVPPIANPVAIATPFP